MIFSHPLETIMLILMRTRKDIQNHNFVLKNITKLHFVFTILPISSLLVGFKYKPRHTYIRGGVI